MNMTAFFLAQRMLLTHTYQKSISTMIIVCFTGIFIGSFALALVTAIMNGFEVAIHQKMQGIHSAITLQSYDNDLNVDAITNVLRKEFPEIIAYSPMSTHHILLRTDNQSEQVPLVAMIKGIDPIKEQQTSSLSQKLISHLPEKNFSQLFTNNEIIIGKQLAHNNHIDIGDSIEILFIRNEQMHGKRVTFDSQPAIVSGIFDTGIDEFDNGVVYSSLTFLEKIFPNNNIEQINIALTPACNEKIIIEKLHDRLGLDVYSWKDLYPSLVATLKLEKYVSFFILALILLVASMNIISLLFMQITQKRADIALLYALGMSHKSISLIFFIIGVVLSCSASLCGLAMAFIISLLLHHYPFITLPDTYYITQLPVAMSMEIIIAVFLLVILLSSCATLLPIQRIRNINISRVLRFEG